MSVGEWLKNQPGLVALYHLEDVTDSSGGGFDLTNVGTTPFNPAKFKNGADGGTANSSRILRVANNLGIDGGAITINAWVKVNTEIASSVWVLLSQNSSTAKVTYDIQYDYNGGTRKLVFIRQGSGVHSINYNIALGTAASYMLTLAYDGTTLFAYVNSSYVGSIAASGSGSNVNYVNSFCILARRQLSTAGDEAFASITADETAVFNRALTPKEIKNYYAWAKGLRTNAA